MFKIYKKAGKGEIILSKNDRVLLYKIAMKVFDNHGDGCEFILDDIPEYNLKVTLGFKLVKRG